MNSLTAFKKIMEKYGKTNTLEGTYDYFLVIKKDLEKLDQLEKIEEELGIDLITLFKALKNGVWTKRLFYDSEWRRYHTFEEANVIEKKSIAINTICCSDWTVENQHKEFIFEVQGSIFYELRLRDYGKTWSLDKNDLTKEELENDK